MTTDPTAPDAGPRQRHKLPTRKPCPHAPRPSRASYEHGCCLRWHDLGRPPQTRSRKKPTHGSRASYRHDADALSLRHRGRPAAPLGQPRRDTRDSQRARKYRQHPEKQRALRPPRSRSYRHDRKQHTAHNGHRDPDRVGASHEHDVRVRASRGHRIQVVGQAL